LKFGENILAGRKDYELIIENEDDLAGLPKEIVSSYKEEASSEKLDGKWVVTLDYPSYAPFIRYSERRELREKIYKARCSLCFNDSKYGNEENIKTIVKQRDKRAKLLGYESYSHFVLEDRMALTPEMVMNFSDDLLKKSLPAAEKEMEELKCFARKRGLKGDFQRWDLDFYSEKLKKETLNVDDKILRPYFKLENVISGIFEVANKLYDLKFTEDLKIDVYHEDVKAYQVYGGDNEFVGLFYADFFPRESKSGGAWMTVYREQEMINGHEIRPHVSIVCNFTKPQKDLPSLLSFQEVLTLFHEFGHALHGLMSKCQFRELSGTNVLRDFVELPSQILENWAYEPECLALFAKHYKTDELIPDHLIEKIKEQRTFQEGLATLRQLSFGLIDMNWHMKGQDVENIEEFEREVMKDMDLFPKVAGINFSCSFSHIFEGGYAVGYYGYKWAEVLDADAFKVFKENGIFDQETSDRFKTTILERGNSAHPMDLYEEFKGAKPTVDALLERSGLS